MEIWRLATCGHGLHRSSLINPSTVYNWPMPHISWNPPTTFLWRSVHKQTKQCPANLWRTYLITRHEMAWVSDWPHGWSTAQNCQSEQNQLRWKHLQGWPVESTYNHIWCSTEVLSAAGQECHTAPTQHMALTNTTKHPYTHIAQLSITLDILHSVPSLSSA